MHYLPEDPDWTFHQLMELAEAGAADQLFADCLHHARDLFDPLQSFVIQQPNHPRICVLLDLMGKIGDQRAAPILMRFLDIDVAELRAQACLSLGWLRSRAALERLDQLEARDSADHVRHEARMAIEEILQDYPAFRKMLKHHRRARPRQGARGQHPGRNAPRPLTDRERLVAALPALLATKYRAAPIRFLPTGELHLAARDAVDQATAERLEQLAGHRVRLESWELPQVLQSINRLYSGGVDEFIEHLDRLTPAARAEMAETILLGVDLHSPLPPLDETMDGVEAAQAVLSLGLIARHRAIRVVRRPDGPVEIIATTANGTPSALAPPAGATGGRFARIVHFLFGFVPLPETLPARKTLRIGEGDEAHVIEGTLSVEDSTEVLTLEFRDPGRN